MDIINMWLNTSLGTSFFPYNINKFKKSDDLVVGESWGKNEFITIIVHLAPKSRHITKIFAIHPFSSLS